MAKKRTKTGTGKKAAAKAERRNEILVAARDVFARKGYHQATIDDIVKAAGVARGTYYLYFEDKRAVFVLVELEGESVVDVAQALGANTNTIYTRLRAARKALQAMASRWSEGERT